MKGKIWSIVLSAELVEKLARILKNASRKKQLNVRERQIAKDFLDFIQEGASPAHKFKLPKGLVLSILRLLMDLLADSSKLKVLLDLFRGGSK